MLISLTLYYRSANDNNVAGIRSSQNVQHRNFRFVYSTESFVAKIRVVDFILAWPWLGLIVRIWRSSLTVTCPSVSKLIRSFVLILLSASMAACVSVSDNRPPPAVIKAKPVVTAPPPRSGPTAISESLDNYIHEQWRLFPGKTGVAVLKIDGSGLVGKRLNDYFPQQSVSKMWVAMAILDQVDQGKLSLNQLVRITPNDLVVFNQPIEKRVRDEGYIDEPIINLLDIAITASDNAANDSLMRVAGGPDAVRAFIAKKGLGQIRFGPGERQLQTSIAGMSWQQQYSVGRTFYSARAQVPYAARKAAMDRYLADPIDGATPQAIAAALGRLAKGELLSASSTRVLLDLMGRVKSGPNRLKAGVPVGWGFVHKTGTGQILDPISTGYNDIGIMTAPDGNRYAVVVLMSDTTATVPQRMAFMQSISRAVGYFHR
jgi:beta-lactamase class A